MTATSSPVRAKLGNILYLTDFSPTSDSAIRYLRTIAEQFDTNVLATHVIEWPEYRFVPPEGWAVVEHASEDAARRQLQNVEERLAGIPHQTTLRRGEVWREAAEMIKAHDIQLIVVGTHGRTGLRRFLMGSVAEEILRLSHCPVLTIGPGVPKDGQRITGVERVVLATDFGHSSLEAIPRALALASEYGARLILLHVIKPPLRPDESFEQLKLESEKQLRTTLCRESPANIRVEIAVRLGDPAAEILRFARERKADLIVLGLKRTGERVTMATHVSPATAHAVLCSAPCPVLAVTA